MININVNTQINKVLSIEIERVELERNNPFLWKHSLKFFHENTDKYHKKKRLLELKALRHDFIYEVTANKFVKINAYNALSTNCNILVRAKLFNIDYKWKVV